MSANGGGGVNPYSATTIVFFFGKGENMQNVLIRKNTYFIRFFFLCLKSYVLDHSESVDMHKEKIIKTPIFLTVSAKNRFLLYGGGGQNFADMFETNSFFLWTPSLTQFGPPI